jgi:hypothetical protein
MRVFVVISVEEAFQGRCQGAVILLHWCYTVVALLLHFCCTVVTLLLHCLL